MISIDWPAAIIHVPRTFMTLLAPNLYELDLDAFRLALKDLEDDDDGMVWPHTHDHNTETVLAGITFARQIVILAPYTVTFEDDQYGVNATGANSNLADVLNRNQVSVNTANSAGLIVQAGGAYPTPADVADAVWDEILAPHIAPGAAAEALALATSISASSAAQLNEVYRLLGLDVSVAVEHGVTYIRIPADGSLVNINVTKAAGKTTLQRL